VGAYETSGFQSKNENTGQAVILILVRPLLEGDLIRTGGKIRGKINILNEYLIFCPQHNLNYKNK
jgi:hypothetical protein